MKYKFSRSLQQGIILSRPNRFVMMVKIGDNVARCHCPSTGRIGNIVFRDIPCMLSEGHHGRKTKYTVEAIKIEDVWIGINQVAINKYMEFFINQEVLSNILVGHFVRERKIEDSRIDFSNGRVLVEVKMPLISLLGRNVDYSKFNSFDRFIKHFGVLQRNADAGYRSIVLLCYMYDAVPFIPPKLDNTNQVIHQAARDAADSGVETWQVNLKIDEEGIEIIKSFKLNFQGRVGIDVLV